MSEESGRRRSKTAFFYRAVTVISNIYNVHEVSGIIFPHNVNVQLTKKLDTLIQIEIIVSSNLILRTSIKYINGNWWEKLRFWSCYWKQSNVIPCALSCRHGIEGEPNWDCKWNESTLQRASPAPGETKLKTVICLEYYVNVLKSVTMH